MGCCPMRKPVKCCGFLRFLGFTAHPSRNQRFIIASAGLFPFAAGLFAPHPVTLWHEIKIFGQQEDFVP